MRSGIVGCPDSSVVGVDSIGDRGCLMVTVVEGESLGLSLPYCMPACMVGLGPPCRVTRPW